MTQDKESETVWHRTRYEDGQIDWETPFVDGKAHGRERHYWPDGLYAQETHFLLGRKHGIETRYRKDGTPEMELPYHDGRFHGNWRVFDRAGQLRRDTPFVAGLQHGVQNLYGHDGAVLHAETWTEGTGVDQEYDEEDRLVRTTAYRGGCKHGPMVEYDEDGKKTREWLYEDGWRRQYRLMDGSERLIPGDPLPARTGAAAAWPEQPPAVGRPPWQKADSYEENWRALQERERNRILEKGECNDPGTALVLLEAGQHLDAVNQFLSGKVAPLKPRGLDAWIFYMLLGCQKPGLNEEARAYVQGLCDRHYNAELPAYVSLDREYDPWDYQLCGCPTDNHLCNDTSNRLAECMVFPDRVFSDGHTAAEYREYWEDAFRRYVAARIRHGQREWRSSIYCHVFFNAALMIYYLMPDGPTKDAAKAFLDSLFLSIAVTLRGNMWTGPHSRVYNNLGSWCGIGPFHQCYIGYAKELLLENLSGGLLASDYAIPEAVARLPFREDQYVSIEKVGPCFYPRGEAQERFNPGKFNVYICGSDREDWGGDGYVYNYMTPRFGLGSVQDWGPYDGEWHMHCIPWAMMLKGAENRDVVLSFSGAAAECVHQGGYMTWHNHDSDQDSTIFQHRKTLLCQTRAWHLEKFYEVLWDGYPEAPWAEASGRKRFLGNVGEKERFFTRFYVSNSIENVEQRDGWIFGEKDGVCFAIRPVRGGFIPDPDAPNVPGRVYLCDVWDDVILLECGEVEESGGLDAFAERLLAAPLVHDEHWVEFTNLEGDTVRFCWKEVGLPTVNGKVPELGGLRFDDPCIRSELNSGIVEVRCEDARLVLDASDPRHPRSC